MQLKPNNLSTNQTEQANRPKPWTVQTLLRPLNLLWLVTFGLLGAKILFSLNIFWQIFNFAFQVDESESMIVAETVLMSRGSNLYALPSPDRFISAPYTPFYYLLNWPFLNFLGPSFKPGRLISFLAACGIAWLLYRLVNRYALTWQGRPNRAAALLAALVWAALGLVAFWGGAVKPDMTALFLSLSGLYLVFSNQTVLENPGQPMQSLEPATPRPRLSLSALRPFGLRLSALDFAALLFALAALTKQTAFAGVLIAGLWLALSGGGWRRLVRFGAVYLVLAFGPMLLMNLFSGGGFWYHIVTLHELPWNSQNYAKFLGAFLQSYQLLGLLALVFLAFWLADLLRTGSDGLRTTWARLRTNPGTLIVLYCGAAWGASFSTGTFGGNHNHLLELAAAGCLALGAAFVRLSEWRPRRGAQKWRVGLAVALALVCWQGLGLFVGEGRVKPEDLPGLGNFGPTRAVLNLAQAEFYNPDWLGLEYRAPLENQKKRLAEIAAFMNNDAGPLIYSDNVSLILATTKPLFTTDPFTQTHATFYGRWDETRLLRMVQGSQFSLVVLRQPIQGRVEAGGRGGDIYLSPALAGAVIQNYRLACRDAAWIYVPKTRTDFKGC